MEFLSLLPLTLPDLTRAWGQQHIPASAGRDDLIFLPAPSHLSGGINHFPRLPGTQGCGRWNRASTPLLNLSFDNNAQVFVVARLLLPGCPLESELGQGQLSGESPEPGAGERRSQQGRGGAGPGQTDQASAF